MSSGDSFSFKNVENAFIGKEDKDLRQAYWLFKSMNNNLLVSMAPYFVNTAFALRLPIQGIIKATIFKHFCGGETIKDCEQTIANIYTQGIGSILDYSVEGSEDEKGFELTTEEILRNIERSSGDKRIPFCVFKTTGIASNILLEKISSNSKLNNSEQLSWESVQKRIESICALASKNNVKLFIDAEETWMQPAIDELATNMMKKYNKQHVIVYNTVQMYRTDRLEYIKVLHEKATVENYKVGLKLVRGAYMEKERKRAAETNITSPIQVDKESTDRDFDLAIKYCVENIDSISICAGTHNEVSCMKLVKLMYENNIAKNDERIYFSQLLGMSNHISFNLSIAGYNVAKYVPYGPVISVMPYLFRRAKENTSISGQMGKELYLIVQELKRRKLLKD